jgi:WD40 repeat protein
VKVWDLKASETAEPVTLRGHTSFVHSVAFSPDGRRLASASGYGDHGEVKVWDAILWNEKGKRGR